VVMKVGGRIHNRPVQGCASLHSSRSWYTLPAWRLCVTAVRCHHSSVLLHGLPQVIATAICRGSGLQVSCQGWRTCLGIHPLLAAQAQHVTTQPASGVAHHRLGPPPAAAHLAPPAVEDACVLWHNPCVPTLRAITFYLKCTPESLSLCFVGRPVCSLDFHRSGAGHSLWTHSECAG
jgi:hypothetical protein